MRPVLAAFTLTGLALALASLMASAQVLQQGLWVTDGSVNAIAPTDSVVYVAGSFTRVGPPIGGAAAIDPASGGVLQPWPQVVGSVNTAISDGSGGWYIGGQFTHVQGQPRLSLAHIDGSGNLTSWSPTPGWAPGLTPIVYALVQNGTTIYIGGDFYTMNTSTRNFIAAVDATTGALTSFDPEPDDVVNALATLGSTVYVGGTFSGIGGQLRSGIAALDATSGAATSWNPGSIGGVYALAVSQIINAPFTITVWAGGPFTFIGGQSRNYLAAIDGGTGLATSWDPDADGTVRSIVLRSGILFGSVSMVYAGGDFTHIGGQPRNHIAAISSSGAATSWDPNANGPVAALAGTGPVYAAGGFTAIGGQNRNYLASIDASSGAATSWDPDPNHTATAVAWNGSTVFAGGIFTSFGGVARTNVAALARLDGSPTGWDPYVSGPVYALALGGGGVYVGGDFFNVGSVLHAHIAAIDPVTGLPTSWTPSTDGPVESMALLGNTLYIGGGFGNVSGATRSNLGAIDVTSGAATSWDPGTTGSCEGCAGDVYAMAVSQMINAPFTITVWVGGLFQYLGYSPSFTPRSYIAAIDGSTGVPTSWNPASNGIVRALALRPGLLFGSVKSVYAGGNFTSIGGQTRLRLAEVTSAGAATSWEADADGVVHSLVRTGSAVYAAGEFANVGAVPRAGLAQLDPTTGAVSAWDAGVEQRSGDLLSVNALAAYSGLVYAGGGFIGALGWPHASLAAISEGTAPAAVGPPQAAVPIALSAMPNPFLDGVSLHFSLSESQPVEVAVYDLSGRRIRILQHGPISAGLHDLRWDGRNDAGNVVDAGVYFARVRGGKVDMSRRLLRIR